MSTWTLVILLHLIYPSGTQMTSVVIPGFKTLSVCKEQGDSYRRNIRKVFDSRCVEVK